MRPIDADALLTERKKSKYYHLPNGDIAIPIIDVEHAPTVQPERERGHWIGSDGSYICSECNGSPIDFIDTMGISFDAYIGTLMNYCPNCGADMRGEKDG